MLSRMCKKNSGSHITRPNLPFNRLLYNFNDVKEKHPVERQYTNVLLILAMMTTENDDLVMEAEPDGTADKSPDVADDVPKETSPLKTMSQSKKRRIVYDKDFLVECFQHPASSKKPSEFPLPNLECTLGSARFGKSPFTAPFVAPKRKEENGKKEKEPEDNISLRPHSGNFSSGCAPNLSPAHLSHNSFTRFQLHEDQTRNLYDRDMSRNNYRFSNNSRVDLNERNRPDRDRERDRDREGRENRDRNNRIQTRRPNSHLSWGTDSEQSDWNRRRNNGSMRQDVKDSRRNCYEKNHREEDLEPEWFSGGPTSQHETIELRGFMDDERRDKPKENRKQSANLNSVGNSTETSTISTSEGSGSAKSIDEGPSEESNDMDLSIEKILKMDHISGILPNGLLEDEEAPSGSSRFSQLFQRNSTPIQDTSRANVKQQNDSPVEREGLAHLFQKSEGEDKSKVIQEMECALRNILLTSKNQEEISNEKSTISDMNAFKMLLQQVVQGNKTGPAEADHKDSPIIHGMGPPPGLAPGIIQNKVQQPIISSSASNSNRNTYTEAFSDLFKVPAQNSACQMNTDMLSSLNDRHNPTRHHPQALNVNHVPRKPAHPAAADPLKKSNNKNVMTPAQFVHLLPPDVQQLVANASVDYDFVMRPEVSKIVNALINGEIQMGEILEQLAAPRSPHRLILVGIVKLCLHGAFNLPNIIIHPVLPRINNGPPGNVAPQKPNYYKKAADENRDHLNKRSGTPVASMSFTPTSVMRKMTAEQQPKTTPPTSQNSFQAFASASSVAPHQAALVNAMSAMNHQGPGSYPIPQYHGGYPHGRHPYPMMIGPGQPTGMPVHHLPHPPYMNYPQPMPMPGPFAFGFRQVTTTTLNLRSSRAPNRNANVFQKLMSKELPMMPQQEPPKNNLSDDLTKLLTSGGHVNSDGARNSIGPQHPMALSLEEVEQMQLGGQARKYQ